ncbi:helix-turn-helix domain-containing protein [Streptomyces sp. NPDC059002]|uniref:helix-turn-helix domain-containing protein n=1 Tax=Streptomyces sp. NPDC059002 TaxID=3346690 RepID=UPI0036C6B48F
MAAGGRPTVRSRRLGTALRKYREGAKLDQRHAADYISGSKAKISRIEAGQVAARPGDVRLLLELYGVEDPAVFRQLEQLARDANKRGWWLNHPVLSDPEYADIIALEADATYIRTWQHLFIPGLLQTDGYARELAHAGLAAYSPEKVDELIAVRKARRRVIEEGGTRYAAVIWEPALTAPMPDAGIHRDQLSHIVDVAQRRNVSVQVMPSTEWRAARMASQFSLFTFGADPEFGVIACDSTTGTVFQEDGKDLRCHAQIFDALGSAALTPEATLSFLRGAIAGIQTSPV